MKAAAYAKRYLDKPLPPEEELIKLHARKNELWAQAEEYFDLISAYPELYPDTEANEKKLAAFEVEIDKTLLRIKELSPLEVVRTEEPAKIPKPKAGPVPVPPSALIVDLKATRVDGRFTGFTGIFKGKPRRLMLETVRILDGSGGLSIQKIEEQFRETYFGKWE